MNREQEPGTWNPERGTSWSLHWHGAPPDSHAVQFSVYSGTLEWKQAVTDAEYAGK